MKNGKGKELVKSMGLGMTPPKGMRPAEMPMQPMMDMKPQSKPTGKGNKPKGKWSTTPD